MSNRKFSSSRWSLIVRLEKYAKNSNFWKAVHEFALKPRRLTPEVNLDKLSKLTLPNDTVLVPGKVLGGGELKHPLYVAAFSFSKSAIEAIEKAGGKAISIDELYKQNPKGSKVKIIV